MTTSIPAVAELADITGIMDLFGQASIKRTIPHRRSILLVDRVTSVDPGRTLTAVKAVTGNEPAYASMSPSADENAYAYPVSLLIESWAQAAVILAAWDTPNPDVLAGKVELAGAINDLRVGVPVYPGSVVEHHVELVKTIGDTSILSGRSTCAGELVLQVASFVLALRDMAVLPRPDIPA
ncbi:hypothetical protein GCM10020218_039960 [Dactylosporangium vinaceum]|uniref:3-hydroxyacyl-ACP dehydratase FabZ family protein n=1 Tax=Dactylosporangium vinaceum TaxID=53362 RepID=A0ABV5ML39_9ACTN|nr:beta-hydroxyacyl-ACP dehydratase [Dactylosporangium vinaceum]